ncbi:MAG: CCA tRNA nucleotidyltransferase [Candidatus Rokubacteria bacterium]|nr:CCA tRNA nucleotidyltransferase [Candidatus Rokubacteria bacterium]
MPRRAHVYPQVEPGAGALVDARVVAVERTATVGAALALARKRDAGVIAVGGGAALRADLARADELGLAALRAAELARPVPIVGARTPEVRVRRALAAGAPAVLVTDGRVPVGAAMTPPDLPAVGPMLERQLPPAVADLLSAAAALAEEQRATAWLVGGVVRDLLRGDAVAGHDVDIVVEGDGHRLARALGERTGGTVVLHERFLTASVEVAGVGTVDVITARSERYERPGALPRVMPAGIRHDLERRDFTVNAMAVALARDRRLVDPHGGRADLARRRLTILHPLSFVEDPTRMFRAARYAARLGFTLDAWTARCQQLALRLAPYPALSGPRIVAELDRILRDAHPEQALARLGRAGAFRLLDPRHRFTAATARRVAARPETLRWLADARIAAAPIDVLLVTLVADQPRAVAHASLVRLGLSGEPLARLERALDAAQALPAALAGDARPSARARRLRGRSAIELAWIALAGGDAGRRAVTEYATRTAAIAPALGGDDVIALGVPRGPEVAEVLDALRDARLDDDVRDRDGEAAYVREWVRTREEG